MWLGAFLALALWEGFVRGHGAWAWLLAALALTVGPVGLIRPGAVRPIFVGWMILAFPIGWTVSQVIVGLMYYGLFTPIGIFFRLIGRDALGLARRPGAESYWSPKTTPTDPKRYLRQF